MADLPQKLDLSPEETAAHPMLQTPQLAGPEELILEAEKIAPQDLEAANLLLAASALSHSRYAQDARVATALQLLAPIIANADPENTLGPDGAWLTSPALSAGWRRTLSSWPKLRYAWREPGGLKSILAAPGESTVDPNDHRVQLLDHLTQMTPGEVDPIQVQVRDSFPPANIAFLATVVGLGFTGWNIYMNWKESEEIKSEMRARKKIGKEVTSMRAEKKKRKRARIRKSLKAS
jgi:hypothetical protein